jgi:thiol:disulfide interchange protein DsbG
MIKMPFVKFAFIFSLLAASIGAQGKDLPAPIKSLEAQGVEVQGTFDAPDGLTGYAGLIGQHPLAIYLTADGKQAIIGTMIDGSGNDLSQEPLDRLVRKPMTVKIWNQLEKSTWIEDGSKQAQRVVYVFTDPNCPYCKKFWNDAQPWIKAGKVQLRHIIVAILTPTSAGKAAALLSAKNPQAALTQMELHHASGGIKPLEQIPASIRTKLDANQNLMEQLGSSATPAIFYKGESGNLEKLEGAPAPEALPKVLGPR